MRGGALTVRRGLPALPLLGELRAQVVQGDAQADWAAKGEGGRGDQTPTLPPPRPLSRRTAGLHGIQGGQGLRLDPAARQQRRGRLDGARER